jgi:hypothetical protein
LPTIDTRRRIVAPRKQPSPAPDDLLIRPPGRDVWVEPHQQMQVMIQHRESTNGHREDLREFPQPFSIGTVRSFTEQERAAHAARPAVIPASHGRIDE